MKRLFLVLLWAAGCGGHSSSGEAQASETHKDFIQLEPGSPRLDFIKIEQVKESPAASVVNLPGKSASTGTARSGWPPRSTAA